MKIGETCQESLTDPYLRVALVAVVGGAGEDGFGAVELLEGDEEGEFVLEGLWAEGPEEVGLGAGGFVPTVGGADHDGAAGGAAVLEGLDFGGEGAAGKHASAFVEEDEVGAFGQVEHALGEAGSGFYEMDFTFHSGGEAGGVVLDAEACKVEGGLAGGDDSPSQRSTGLKSAAW